jgi:SAM-dependent methyltransferase
MGKGGKNKQKKDKTKKRKKGRPSKAERSDRHDLYQRAVQFPEADVEFFAAQYKERRGKDAKILREDFCGTSYLSCTWVQSDPERKAIGVDFDGPTLDWAREHNMSKLDDDARARVTLFEADVLDGPGEPADIACAMNFSYCVFKKRAQLKRYFQVAYEKLAADGIFILELYGGTEAIAEDTEERECEGFDYVWEQEKYNPITNETLCHIHFEFRDGSRMDKAFTYDWRLWSIPELRELLEEVGFDEVGVYWEEVDDDGDGTGEYVLTEEEDNQESWLVHLVAAK